MRIKKGMFALLLLVASVIAAPCFALPITGDISFASASGTTVSWSGSLIDYTPNADNATVTGTFGDFSSIADGTLATFFDLTYNPFTSPSQLWSVAGLTYWATSLSVDLSLSSVLALSGNGYVTDGMHQSSGSWNLTLNRSTNTSSFSSSAEVAAVPEASALGMLGLGLIGMGLVRRFR